MGFCLCSPSCLHPNPSEIIEPWLASHSDPPTYLYLSPRFAGGRTGFPITRFSNSSSGCSWLAQRQVAVCRDVLQALLCAGGPQYFDQVHAVILSEAEVHGL